MSGITRYHITDKVNGPGAWRFGWAEIRQPQADAIYRMVCERIKIPLEAGSTEHIEVKGSEFAAGYDKYLGIDVHLHSLRGQSLTLQEKFLSKPFHHVTVEYFQDHKRKVKGDWFNLMAQFYFVGYDHHNRTEFDEWILLNWPSFQTSLDRYRVPFDVVENGHDGAQSSLARVHFDDVPNECVVAVQRPGRGIEIYPNHLRQLGFDLDIAAD